MNNTHTTPGAMEVIRFQDVQRLTRKAIDNAVKQYGNMWYCQTIEGKPAFVFEETNVALVVPQNRYQDFLMHLQCGDFQQIEFAEKPENWN